jgi:hypothetical protein
MLVSILISLLNNQSLNAHTHTSQFIKTKGEGERKNRGNNKCTEYLTGKLDGTRPLSSRKMRKGNRCTRGPVGDSGS